MKGPLVALDVQYADDRDLACAAAVWFADWDSEAPLGERARFTKGLAAYVPGAFYQRELPCLFRLVEPLLVELSPHALLVDAHVDLGPDLPGLGRHLYDALQGQVRVVGIAKRSFRGGIGQPVLRGTSQQPLWVSATSDPDEAVAGVARMAGEYRVPTLLKLADHNARLGLTT